jgi:hypothetical protein
MFNFKEKLNKFNMLITISILLLFIVIGQSIYIANIYAKSSNMLSNRSQTAQLPDQNIQSSKPHGIFDDFDNDFMSNHFKEFREIK